VDSLAKSRPGFISLVTLVETHWVLRYAYHYKAEDINDVIGALIEATEFVVDD